MNSQNESMPVAHYVEKAGYNDLNGYYHYLYIKDDKASDKELIDIAQRYVNSLKTNTPVFTITVVNSIEDFSVVPDEQDLDSIRKTYIAELEYEYLPDGKQGKFTKITTMHPED